jgi:hypothetical protein
MSNLVVPESVATQLADSPHIVHLCNSSGKTLGYFVPAADPALKDALEPGLSNEELRKIEQSNPWHTTEEVLKHLENLG